MGTHRKELSARTSEQHVLAAHMPEQHAAVLKSADGNAVAEIRSGRFVGVSHVSLARIQCVAESSSPPW
jgi:hypothetical protein